MTQKVTLIFTLFFALFITSHLSSQETWAYVCGNTVDDFENGNLISIDRESGAGTSLGQLCGNAPLLTIGEFVSGVYYYIDAGTRELLIVNADASCTTVGTISGILNVEILGGLSHDLSTGITYVLTTVGARSTLYTIDLSTAVATPIGNTGILFSTTLSIDNNGNAYVIDLFSRTINPIDLSTGVAGAGVAITDGINSIPLNLSQDIDFDCSADGILSGIITSAGGSSYGTLDPITGVFTEIAFLGTRLCGYSVDCRLEEAEIIPTLGEWGLLSLAILFIIMGVVRIKQENINTALDIV